MQQTKQNTHIRTLNLKNFTSHKTNVCVCVFVNVYECTNLIVKKKSDNLA